VSPTAGATASPELGLDLSRAVAAVLALGDDSTHPAGAVVGVLANGRMSTAAGGVAVAAAGDQPARAMTTDTRLDVASVTKMASSTALAMRLVADGSLTLDAPVTDYLPGFGAPGTAEGVTVRHLLEHTSGLPPWVPLYCRTTDRAEALTLAAATPLVAEPGARWAYSDLGMVVLGAVIEAATGKRQDAVFAERVAAPLELRRTAYGPVPVEETAAAADSDVIEHRMVATGDPYPTDALVSDFAGWRKAPVVGTASDGNAAHALGGVAGHAGLFATVPELLRIGRSLVDPDVVPTSVIAEFTRPLAITQDRGLGLRLGMTSLAGQNIPFAFHPGFTGAWLGVALDRDLVIAVAGTRLHTTTGSIESSRARRSDLVTTDAIAAATLAEVSAALASAGHHPAPTGAP
jgi:CubicO group peptidase (beta-lactamase class C family)